MIVLTTVFIAGCTKTAQLPSNNTEVPTAEVKDHQLIPIEINGKPLTVEAVISIESITEGLGDRDSIGSDGMLFFLPDRQVATFWMHGMRFPLDFVWIDDNKIVGIEKNVPAPSDPTSMTLPTYSSKVPVAQVLELPAGRAEELGLSANMIIQYK